MTGVVVVFDTAIRPPALYEGPARTLMISVKEDVGGDPDKEHIFVAAWDLAEVESNLEPGERPVW